MAVEYFRSLFKAYAEARGLDETKYGQFVEHLLREKINDTWSDFIWDGWHLRDVATFDFWGRNERLNKDKVFTDKASNQSKKEIGSIVDEMIKEVDEYNSKGMIDKVYHTITNYFNERSSAVVNGDFAKAIKLTLPRPSYSVARELDKLTREERIDLLQGLIPGNRRESAEWMVERKLDYIWLEDVSVYFSKIDGTLLRTEATLRPEYRDGLRSIQKKLLLEPLYILRKQGEIDRKNYKSLGEAPG